LDENFRGNFFGAPSEMIFDGIFRNSSPNLLWFKEKFLLVVREIEES